VERERAQIMSRLRREALSPNEMANRSWWATAFPGHPYGLPVNGTLESVPKITIDDLKSYTRRSLARDNVKIAIVGDIDAETAGALIDRAFGALPAKAELKPVAPVVPQGLGRRVVINLDVPQAVVYFGGPGIARSDPDFIAAYIVNHILGGGAFSSRLYLEVREKRGLAYGVSDSLVWLNQTALLLGTPPRAPMPPGRPSRSSSARSVGSPKKGPPKPSSSRPRPISRAPLRSASTPRTALPASSCRCRSTISASTISSGAARSSMR